MGYTNGKSILPKKLLKKIQKYIDGEYIYIPCKKDNKKPWGTNTKSKLYLSNRNKEIFLKYSSGISVKDISKEYHLATKTIYGILSQLKR